MLLRLLLLMQQNRLLQLGVLLVRIGDVVVDVLVAVRRIFEAGSVDDRRRARVDLTINLFEKRFVRSLYQNNKSSIFDTCSCVGGGGCHSVLCGADDAIGGGSAAACGA